MPWLDSIRRLWRHAGEKPVETVIDDHVFGPLRVSDNEWRGAWAINPGGGECAITIMSADNSHASLAAAREVFRDLREEAAAIRKDILALLKNEPIGEYLDELLFPGIDENPTRVPGPLGVVELESVLIDVSKPDTAPQIELTYTNVAPGHWSHFTIEHGRVTAYDISG